MKILLVEDEKRMAQALCQILRLEIMRLITALMGFPVWKPLKQTYKHKMKEGIIYVTNKRMSDVKKRYGSYPQNKWDFNIRLMYYFEEKMDRDISLFKKAEKISDIT